ncbi:unnamed protein product [Diabrotica balteata]|uniref:ZAD domain-containing protein n=1 Tax=Diabrotica balteata TaxID=107213 RepID=A0A9N9ST65_DIABA|nr:unnamed protein product [Diabrotica balteata]
MGINLVRVEHDDGLPQNICDSCIAKLEEISDFIDLVKYNHSCLKRVHKIKSDLKKKALRKKCQRDYHNDQHKERQKYYDETLDAVTVVEKNDSEEASEKGLSEEEIRVIRRRAGKQKSCSKTEKKSSRSPRWPCKGCELIIKN